MGTAPALQTKPDSILVADEVWVALALLHREQPERLGFTAGEIRNRVEREKAHPELRSGVGTHVSQQCVANVPPTSGTYRMLYRLPDSTYRLYRLGDECHPKRKGKTIPYRAELPEKYHYLLDWYEQVYCTGNQGAAVDPVLAMVGVGKDMWMDEDGDAFVNRLRGEWLEEDPAAHQPKGKAKSAPDFDRVWARIIRHEGEDYKTITRLPFTYRIDRDHGMWFYREGKRIEKKLWRGDVKKAVERCPLTKVTDIKDVFDPSYLFAVLMDKRIRDCDW